VAPRSSELQGADPLHRGRMVLLIGAGVLMVVFLVPPLSVWARRFEFVEALQFTIFAIVVPVLFVAGSPWRLCGLATQVQPEVAALMTGAGAGLPPVDRLALARVRHPDAYRSVFFGLLFLVGAVLWRIPPTVDALARHPWLVVVEAIVLLVVGAGLWLELIESPPLTPRLTRPHRIALAAVCMWTVWVLAYFVGLSHGSWYHAYSHHPGGTLSLSADQQLTTGTMWFVSGCAFIPVVFWNLIRWLQSEENPDQELHRLMREERTRGRSLDGGRTSP
jgi:cytochrome c oxidase assembly factor CtaG